MWFLKKLLLVWDCKCKFLFPCLAFPSLTHSLKIQTYLFDNLWEYLCCNRIETFYTCLYTFVMYIILSLSFSGSLFLSLSFLREICKCAVKSSARFRTSFLLMTCIAVSLSVSSDQWSPHTCITWADIGWGRPCERWYECPIQQRWWTNMKPK